MKKITDSALAGGVVLAVALSGCGLGASPTSTVPPRTIGVTLLAQVRKASATPPPASPTTAAGQPDAPAPTVVSPAATGSAATDTPAAQLGTATPSPPESLPTVAPTLAPPSVPAGTEGGAALLALHNAIRAQMGLAPYVVAAQLNAAAQTQSDFLATQQQQTLWSMGARGHTGGDGSTYVQRVARAGYAAASSNESWVFSDSPAGCFDWWLNDAGHKPAIISSDYTQIGFGLTPHAAGGVVCVAVYARPQ